MIRNSILRFLGASISKTISPGFNLGNINISFQRPSLSYVRSGEALKYALNLKPKTVIDVGSGGGFHAKSFIQNGAVVDCIDFGTSIYAQDANYKNLSVRYGDFNTMHIKSKYEIVWASHVLEHQRNIGIFLDKLISCCEDNGRVIITVPAPHRRLLGGHLSLWSPGLLVYNVVMAGVDLNNAIVIAGRDEYSLIFSPKRVNLPDHITYDKGDIEKLAHLLPDYVVEGADQFNYEKYSLTKSELPNI